MGRSWGLVALAVLAVASKSRAACDDIDQYLSIPSPLTEDIVLDLDDVSEIVCEEIDDDGQSLEEVIVDGAYTVTLRSSNNVSFVNLGFTATSGANLVFDMPNTNFGPNSEGFHRSSYQVSIVEIEEGAAATFLGNVVAQDVSNCFSIFANSGDLEIKGSAHFEDGSNVFRVNYGTVKFRGDATFKNHRYLAVQNEESGYFRFSKTVVFDNNAYNFDGAWGCSAANRGADAKIVFRGDVEFKNNDCGEGVALYNEGTTNFYGKAYFNDNTNDYSGGAVSNYGSMKFSAAAQFNNNDAGDSYGGGISVGSGDVTFKKSVTFDGNSAGSGAAFSVANGGVLTFEKPSVVRFRNGLLDDYQSGDDDGNCLIGYVVEGGTVVGFPGDDICDSADDQ
ncbi:unnamed protein product [Scytosiphon promiscuus]